MNPTPPQRSALVGPREPAATVALFARRPRVLLVVLALLAGYPLLHWLESLGLVVGRPAVLAVLLALVVLAASRAGQRVLGEGQPWDRPMLRLAVAVALIGAFAGALGWSVAAPVAASLVAVREIQRSGSHRWRAAGSVVTAGAVLGQVGVELGVVPSVIPVAMSHLATASILALGWVGIADVGLSVAQRERSQRELARTEARLRALMDSSRDVLTVADATGHLTYVSPAIERAIGYAPHALIGSPLLQLVDAEQRPEVGVRLHEVIQAGLGAHTRLDVLVVHTSGERRWYEWTARNLLDDPLVEGLVVDQRDVTDRRLHAEQLAHAAAHDELTGLPNRGELLRRLAAVLPQAVPGAGVAVLFIDLDRFKQVNDTHGHATGDQLLVVVAQRLQACLRPQDHLARLGGDEFCAILTEVRHQREVHAVVERLEAAVAQPVALAGGLVSVGASIGVALTTDARRPPDDLFAAADGAMYAVKHARQPATGPHRTGVDPRHPGQVRGLLGDGPDLAAG